MIDRVFTGKKSEDESCAIVVHLKSHLPPRSPFPQLNDANLNYYIYRDRRI